MEPVHRRLDTPSLADELLEEIFIRIGSPADLIRASAACASFRRVIAGRYFLRRVRSVHLPLLLGFVHPDGFEPARAPHPSAPVARALALVADFSFDRLLPPKRWKRRDARNGLVLLECITPDENSGGGVFPDLAVCDPLSRRHLLLPPVPDNLVASAAVQMQMQQRDLRIFEASLAPRGDGEEEETAFRVIGKADSESGLVVFVFSSTSGNWSIGESTTWDALNLKFSSPHLNRSMLGCIRYCAYGSIFWKLIHQNKLLMLDLSVMKFSTVDLPSHHEGKQVVIVEAGKGRLGMLSGIHIDGRAVPGYYYYTRESKDGGGQEWMMRCIVALSQNHHYSTVGVADGYILLCRVPNGAHASGAEYLSIEVKTSKVEWVSAMGRICHVYPYVGFPPSLSPRRI